MLADLHLGGLVETAFPYGFLNHAGLDSFANVMCKVTLGAICEFTVNLICGLSQLDTAASITNLTAHYPAGTSVKEMNHFEQLFLNGGFTDYDYGTKKNKERYGQATPPAFNLSGLEIPTALFTAGDDDLADHDDVASLTLALDGSPALIYNQEYPEFSHMTWLVGNADAFHLWFPGAMHWLDVYNPVQGSADDVGVKIEPSETIPEYLLKYEIPVEEHWATTDDGYILKLFRLPNPGAPVLMLQHGILASAWCWLDNSPELAPGIRLYNEGYDIWMTNNRGNLFSKNHTTLDPDHNEAFWNFSFADLGRHDVPTNIKYILGSTGKPNLSYVGWSQGTSQFFVAMTDATTKAYVDQSVNLFVALSPVTFMKYQTSGLLKIATDLRIGAAVEKAFPYGFLDVKSLDVAANTLCKLTAGVVCEITVDLICGTSHLDTAGAITNLTAHFPAGTSVKSLNHYEQLILGNDFCDYDFGKDGNMEQYGQATPPSFDVSKISVPTALFVGGQDTMADHKDVGTLTLHIQFNPALIYHQEFPDFSHVTWFTGTDSAFKTWYPIMSRLLQQHNGVVVI